MRFRDEILRGVRLDAILFALALLAVVIHRMVRLEASAPAPAVEQPEQPPKPAVIGGSALPGSTPPPPPAHGNPVTLVRSK